MTTREEIGEVIDQYADDDCLYLGKDCEYRGSFDYCTSTDDAYTCLMERFGKLGVVIKVDRELPQHLMEGQIACDRATYQEMLRKAGYVAVESLIED